MGFFALYNDMKGYFYTFVLCMGFFLHSCGPDTGDQWSDRYTLELPDLPPAWEMALGIPQWRVEWLNSAGRLETATVTGNGKMTVSLPQTVASPVLARPFWPDKGLIAGIFRPAGAIFPFDVSGKNLVLGWQGGIDANLFWELAGVCGIAVSDAGPETDDTERAALRQPQNFDWPRFRLLFADPTLNAEIRGDPWLADWRSIAEKIVLSGFDKRRLVPEPRGKLTVPVGPGPWIGTSPFAPPLLFEGVPVFPVRAAADTWVSSEGIVRCNTETWILLPIQ
jgi:hypothetical protein